MSADEVPAYPNLHMTCGSDITAGLWCAACSLPSVIKVPVYMFGDGPELVFCVLECTECGSRNAEAAPP